MISTFVSEKEETWSLAAWLVRMPWSGCRSSDLLTLNLVYILQISFQNFGVYSHPSLAIDQIHYLILRNA